MAFEQKIPHPLTANGVQRYAPMAPGIYGMSNAREWVYIGQSENIQVALLEHLRVLDTAVLKWEPTGFVFEACTGAERQSRQNSLILEYSPICNQGSSRRSQIGLRKGPRLGVAEVGIAIAVSRDRIRERTSAQTPCICRHFFVFRWLAAH